MGTADSGVSVPQVVDVIRPRTFQVFSAQASHKFCDYLWAILGLSENYQKPARYLSPWLGNILQQQEYIVQQLQVFSCAVQMQLAAMPHTNFAIICGLF
jgi:hypothetical protein